MRVTSGFGSNGFASLASVVKFKGYFDLSNIPFRHISLFDFMEKKSPL